jgi:hypothetical protein
MRPLWFQRMLLTGAAAVTMFVAPSAKGSAIVTPLGAGANGGSGGTTVTVDLGTVGYGVNVNATILYGSNLAFYTYQQLLFGGTDLNAVLDNGFTVGEVLAQDVGNQPDPGTLDYNFPFAGGASGSFSQNGPSPPFPPPSMPGAHGFTATSVSGNVCPGSNSVGSMINLDPLNAGNTFAAILGCDNFTIMNNGVLTPTTQVMSYTLGTITSTSQVNGNVATTVTVVEAEDMTTSWILGAQADDAGSSPAAAPEPWSGGLAASGIGALWMVRIRTRRRT